jgi:hypothetical protein
MPGVVHQPGGQGKTTLGMPQAHALVPTGTKVCIVDAGPPAAAPDRAASAAEGTPSRYPLYIRGPLGQKDTGKWHRPTIWPVIFSWIVRQPWTVLDRIGTGS